MRATASWCWKASCHRPIATPCRRARPSWWRASIPDRCARSFRRATQGHAGDRYFRESGGAIRFFFEEHATDQPVALALNKIGHALHDLDPVFDRISRQPRMAALARALGLVQPLLLQSMYLFKQPQIGAEVGWHQDATYLCTRPVTVTGLWIALDDADRDNGCLMALPGGHRGPLRQRFHRAGAGLVTDDARRHAVAGHRAGRARGTARQPGRAARAVAACQRAQPVGAAAPRLCLAPDRRACGVCSRQLAAKAGPAAARIYVIPKAELHCHLEGSIPPALARELAARNGLGVPPGLIGEHGHYVWKDFLSFLATYDLVCTTLRVARDFGDVIYSYLAGAARQGAVYVEMFCSPERPAALGITYNAWLEALEGGIDRARRDFGIEGRIIIICIRHLGPERALAMARVMVAEPHHYVVGFGMGGDEAQFTPADFAPAYRLAHDKGFGCTVHAGEVLGPESVWAAINDLPVTRIGHGVRSADDPALMAELARRGIVLEVCPGSNIALGLYPNRAAHPLHRLIEAGVRVTLNSDDPPFFHTSLGAEYDQAGLGEAALRHIARTAVEASFADAATKQRLLREMGP